LVKVCDGARLGALDFEEAVGDGGGGVGAADGQRQLVADRDVLAAVGAAKSLSPAADLPG
jgi:hypothetical protein